MKLLFISLLILISFNVLSGDMLSKNEAVNIINSYRPLILEKLNDTLFLFNKERNDRINLFNKELTSEILLNYKNNILKTLELISVSLSNKRVFNKSGYLSNYFSTGYIEDVNFYSLWLKLFDCDDFQIISWAYDVIFNYSREDYLVKFNKEIRKGIISYREMTCLRSNSNIWCKRLVDKSSNYNNIKDMLPGDELFLLLPLTIDEKKLMLSKNIPIYFRVRLGDKDAENKLISCYEKEIIFNNKWKLARELGLAGTQECAKALIRSLNTHIEDSRRDGNYTSARIAIISALSRIHPEETFLRYDISFIHKHGDFNYGGSDSLIRCKTIQNYLTKVIVWAERSYNEKPSDLPPEPKLCVHKVLLGGSSLMATPNKIVNSNATVYSDSIVNKLNKIK